MLVTPSAPSPAGPSVTTTTDASGRWVLDVPAGDSLSDIWVAPAPAGAPVTVPSNSSLCHDASTLSTLLTPLAAPQGRGVVSPLSTLLVVMRRGGVADAEAQLERVLGLSAGTIGTTDVFQLLLADPASQRAQVGQGVPGRCGLQPQVGAFEALLSPVSEGAPTWCPAT